jgi:hypothetical protein
MRVTQIIAEEKIDEAPVSGIKQGLRKIGAKTLAKLGAKDTARGIAGKVDTGNRANELYSNWREHLGGLEGKPNQVDAAEFRSWLQQNKMPVASVPQTGILKDKQIQQIIKQAVINSKRASGTAQQPNTPPTPNDEKTPPVKPTTQQDPNNTNTQQGDQSQQPDNTNTQQGDQSQQPNNTNTPAKITPEIQKQLDALTPEQAKELAKML